MCFIYLICHFSGRNPIKHDSLSKFVESAQKKEDKKLEKHKIALTEICLRPKPTVNIGVQTGNWIIDEGDVKFQRDLADGNFGEVKLCKYLHDTIRSKPGGLM